MSFVSTIKHTPSIHRPEAIPSTSKAERVLGIGMPDPVLAPKGQSKNQSRAAKWLRALGAKGTKGKGVGVKNGSGGLVPPIGVDNPLINNEPRRKVSTASDFPDIDEFDGSLPSEPSSPISSDPPPGDGPPAEGGSYEFQFEGRPVADSTDQIEPGSADTSIDTSFDLQSPTSALPPSGGQGGSVSPRTSAISPRVSRAFSKRSSILPGPAIDILGGEPEPPVPPLPAHLRKPTGYEKSLHVYAVQSLREYEQTVQVSTRERASDWSDWMKGR